MDKIALFLLRISVGGIFLSFGIGKFQGDIWAETIKTMQFFQMLPWSVEVSVKLIGTLEVLTGSLLILGVYTPIAAAIAAGQLGGILFLLHFQEIRDIGLLTASIYLAVTPDDTVGLGWFFDKRN